MMELRHRELMPGVQLTAVQTNKFKTCHLSITFLEPLSEKTAAENALLPAVLRRGTKQHPDMIAMSAALDELYGGMIEPVVRKKGETQCIGLIGSFLDDAYTPKNFSMLESATKFMAEILLEPVGEDGAFHKAYLESEKANLVNRIRSRVNDKQQYAMYRLTSQMCAEEAYGVDKLGEEANVHAITGESLWRRYQTLLETAPIHIYYCGAATVDQVEAAMKMALAGLPTGSRKFDFAKGEDVLRSQEAPRYFEDRMDVTQGKLTMGFRLDEPHTEAKLAASLLVFNAIYGGSTNSKLFMNVRERLSLCYYASTIVEKHKGLLLVSSGIAFDQYQQAKDEILAQLDDCRKGKIEPDEFESARRFIVNNLRTMLDAQGKLEDYWLGQAVANCYDAPEILEQAVKQVTLEDVKLMAQKLWLDSVYFLQGKEGAYL